MLSVVNHNLRNYLEQIATFLFVFNNRTVPREGEDITIIYPYPVFKLTMPLPLYLGDKLKQAIKSCFMFPRKQMLGGGGGKRGQGGQSFHLKGMPFSILIHSHSHILFLSLFLITNAPKQTTPNCGTKPPFYSAHMFWSSGIQREHSGNGWTLQCLGPQLGVT